MKNIKRITLSITLFFMCSTAMVHAQISDDRNQGAKQNESCIELKSFFKVRINKALKVHKVLHQTLQSNQIIDKYNRHMNILFGNLNRYTMVMEKLLVDSKENGCSELIVMRNGVVSLKKIHDEMMASIQLPNPKGPLSQQSNKLKSELDNMLKAGW